MGVAFAASVVGPAVSPAEARTPAPAVPAAPAAATVPVAPPVRPAPPLGAKPLGAKARLQAGDAKLKAGDYAGGLEDAP